MCPYTNTEIRISGCQISDMKHAIGYEHRKVKRGKYRAYRNYYSTNGSHSSWDALVADGLATKKAGVSPVNGMSLYKVSPDGIALLSSILDVFIDMSDA